MWEGFIRGIVLDRMDTGCWILDAGYWILDAGYWMLDTGCWILDILDKLILNNKQ